MATRRRPSGRTSCAVAALLAVVAPACAGTTGGRVGADVTTAPTTTVAVHTPAVLPTVKEPAAPEPWNVTLSVLAGRLDATLSVDDALDLEPFGRFAACSGLRSRVAAYGVSVRDHADAGVRAVSVHTDAAVDGPGTYASTIMVEPSNGPALVVAGTMRLNAGLQSGTFTGLDSTGSAVTGRFDCTGPESGPTPLAAGGEVDLVEVAAYLTSGDSEEIAGLTAVAGDAATLECPGTGSPDTSVVSVEGDRSLGAMTAFELDDRPRPALRMQVGAAVYELLDVALDLAPDRMSGTFAGTTGDGVMVDGAFRCG